VKTALKRIESAACGARWSRQFADHLWWHVDGRRRARGTKQGRSAERVTCSVTRQSLGWPPRDSPKASPASPWDGARQSLGWSPPVLGMAARQY
jgi:hypothetical protein